MPSRSKWDFSYIGGESSASDAVEIVPSDTVDLVHSVRGLYIGGAGNVKLTTLLGNEVTFIGLSGIVPVGANRVHATGTTATSIVGLI